MPNVTFELLIIFVLLLANGYLALSEIAVVSARRPRLLQRAERGDPRARVAAELSASPTRFLSTVQVGITLIGILSGAYGGATLARELAPLLARYPAVAPYSEPIAVGAVVVILSFMSVVIGEIVPKRIALSAPERFASLVARPMARLSRLGAPAVTALEVTSNLIIRLFRLPHGGDAAVTEADVAAMLAAGTAAGVFEPAERRMVERVFRLDDEPVAAMMTPRREIVWLNVDDSPNVHLDVIRRHPYSRFPVCDGSLDRILGVMHVRDLWLQQQESDAQLPELRVLVRKPLYVPDRTPALDVLGQFQSTGTHVAIVIDEHGGVEGMLTLNNILTFLVAAPGGMLPAGEKAPMVQRGPDSWLVDGTMSLGDFYAAVGVEDPEGDRPRAYHTAAGLLMATLGRLPNEGDCITVGLLTLEVTDMDGFRVDKLLVTRKPAAESHA